MTYTYLGYPGTQYMPVDLSILLDPIALYNPANLVPAVIATLIVFSLFSLLIYVLLKPSREIIKKSFYATSLFVAVDFAFHYFFEALAVSQPIYSIEKYVLTLGVLVLMLSIAKKFEIKWLKNKHIMSALIVLLLEWRYIILYPGRLVWGVPFDLVLLVLHYFLLYFSLKIVFDKELKWEWY